ncbi:MAG TPA: response regulator transcription factor [Stellaceae bacterium]|jgi:two-component system KDP operon response regulator KdpE|nr:response regulator transcription factor [Stellaceae bacterium]
MGASTIVVAREDLSIPGSADADVGDATCAADIEARFFNVIRQYNPDVVVLDLTHTGGQGTTAIVKIRRRSGVPILVVCGGDDLQMREYCLAGAAECMAAPVDIMALNQTVQKIIQLSRDSGSSPLSEAAQTQPIFFAELTLQPHENTLTGPDGASIKLTTSENRVLIHFVSNPWMLCTRDALADALYGPHRPNNSDRAVDVIVTRLRKKIASLGGLAAQRLIKTEFRRGYMFVTEVSIGAPIVARQSEPALRARTA